MKALGRIREVINDMVLFNEDRFQTYFVGGKTQYERDSKMNKDLKALDTLKTNGHIEKKNIAY